MGSRVPSESEGAASRARLSSLRVPTTPDDRRRLTPGRNLGKGFGESVVRGRILKYRRKSCLGVAPVLRQFAVENDAAFQGSAPSA